MKKFLIVCVVGVSLAGCTVREQQLATAGVAGAIVGSALTTPRPVYIEEPRYVPVPPRRPRCFVNWERTPYGMVERRVCDRY